MKKVLWIACLLCLMPFLGNAQGYAGLVNQDEEAAFGQSPVSNELPASIHLQGINVGNNRSGGWTAHGMFVPPQNDHYGRYYTITETGEVTMVEMYNDWYYSSAEYCTATEFTGMFGTPETLEKVWAYSNDYLQGFVNMNLENGQETSISTITLNMNDLTYDYSKDRMLGVKNGRIYRIRYTSQNNGAMIFDTLYDYRDHNNIQPIAIAADLNGDLYFVSTSDGTENSKLYKITWNADGSFKQMDNGKTITPNWQARRIQTMAFDHNTGTLYWYQCREVGAHPDDWVNFVSVNKNTGATTKHNTETLSTEISGLFFEFDYVPHWAKCVDANGNLLNDGTLKIGTVYQKQFLPGKTVTVTVTPPSCMTMQTFTVVDHNDPTNVYYTTTTLPTNKKISFSMPAYDVDIRATWAGTSYGLTANWTPTAITNGVVTNPAQQAQCNSTVNVTYQNPEGYMLTNLTAKKGTTNITLATPANYATSFTMPEGAVTVTGTYKTISVGQADDICQHHTLDAVPAVTVQSGAGSYQTTYYVGLVPATGGNPTYTAYTATQLAAHVFTTSGLYRYYAQLHNTYGDFQTATAEFEVVASPASLSIVGNRSVDGQPANNQYSCIDGSIMMTVDPAGLVGQFTWEKKNGTTWTEIATTTVDTLILEPLAAADAGLYRVSYTPTPATGVVPTLDCDVTSNNELALNLASVPNKPEIVLVGTNNPICYNTTATLAWNAGVLNADEYTCRWYTLDQTDNVFFDGNSTNGFVPVYGWYADAYLRSQYILPATELAELDGQDISAITFYQNSVPGSYSSLDGTFEVKLTEVDYATFASATWADMTEATTVYTGQFDFSATEIVLPFSNPYTYNGGNLLVEVTQTTPSSGYPNTTFVGTNVTNGALQYYSYSSVSAINPQIRGFVPKTGLRTGGWVLLNETGAEITTPVLTEEATYQLIINYGGTYAICESEPSDPFTVNVKPESFVVFDETGATETCQGFAPMNNPLLDDLGYTNITWTWDDGVVLNETTAELHLNNDDIHPTADILDQVGVHTITVNATDADGCPATGTWRFEIKPLPTVTLTYITDDGTELVATPEHDITIEVCAGSILELTANGADTYDWGTVGNVPTTTATTVNDVETAASMEGWTTIDADGDGYDWVLGSNTGGVYLVNGGSLAGSGHYGSADMICSGSYSNVVGPLYPDNYFITPELPLGGTLTFWAAAQDATYAAEHFGVAVSTAGNTDPNDFDMVEEWDMTSRGVGAPTMVTRSGNRDQGVWYQYTVDLSAYSGQGYIAFRHFECTDQFIINIDDINYVNGDFTLSQNFDPTHTSIIQMQPYVPENWQVTGTSATTQCLNTATVHINVKPLPEITWVSPSADTTFSMITEQFQLVANPTTNGTGIFTYIIDGIPDVSYPIDNGIFMPATIGIGNYQLIYSFTDATTGCTAEERIHVTIEKPYWTDKGKRDEDWFDDCLAAGRFEITNPAQLGAFAAYLNYNDLDAEDQDGIFYYNFDGDTVYITNRIDLQEKPYFFRPINEFVGVLDGTGKVVSNMVILEDELAIYLNQDGFIRNLGVKDARITNLNAMPCFADIFGSMHNCYFTMPMLTNVYPQYAMNAGVPELAPTGDVQNLYYYGPLNLGPLGNFGNISVYLNKTEGGFSGTMVVGDEASTTNNSYVPAYEFYNYSFTHQLYLADEINAPAGRLTEIAFYLSATQNATRDWAIYMSNTSSTSLTASDVAGLSEANKVWEGAFDYSTAGWVNIVLDTPFDYTGENLIVTVDDNTGDYFSSRGFKVEATTYNAALRVYNDNTDFEVGNDYGYTTLQLHNVLTLTFNNEPELTVITPVLPTELLTNNTPYEGLLEKWVWLKNDFAYRDWLPDDGTNYGYPIMNTSFVHHHYITVNDFENGTYTMTGQSERTLDGVDYVYAMNGETITFEVTPDQYCIVDSVTVEITDYQTLGNNLPAEDFNALSNTGNVWTLVMPADSLYWAAYNVEFNVYIHKDYWTDEGNYDDEWFANGPANTGRWEIHSNRELAAFARAIMDGYTFANEYVWIDGAAGTGDDQANKILDMTGHFWWPIEGFEGVLDGNGYIVDNLYTREDVNGMFVAMGPNALVRNLGVQDVDMPEGSVVFANEDGAVHNSYVTVNPNLHLFVGIGDCVVLNSYTLDENGNKIDNDGNGIELGDLNAWVYANQDATDPQSTHYYLWTTDDNQKNYGYPVHDMFYIPGIPITYIPASATPDNGYVSGPESALEDDVVNVDTYPATGYNLTKLAVFETATFTGTYDPDAILFDILDTKEFVMPDYPVTVYAEFTPIEWTLTVQYKYASNGATAWPSHTETLHYQDEYSVVSPIIPGYTADRDTVTGTMPNGHWVETVRYTADWFNVILDPNSSPNVTLDTDPTGGQGQYNSITTIVIGTEPGYSISTITATSQCQPVINLTPAGNGTYTFMMPACDVTVTVTTAEEFWTDYGIRDIHWYVADPTATEYTLTTDSMLGGFAALVSGMCGSPDEEDLDWLNGVAVDFAGVTINVELPANDTEGKIDLIENKWKPVGAQIDYAKQFQGTFNGNDVEIVNMRTKDMTYWNNDPTQIIFNGSCQAFFGNIGENGVVNGLNIQGTAEGRYFTAGIAGVNYGLIINSVAKVNVLSEFEAGGIVANNEPTGRIINTYCEAETIESHSAGAKYTNDFYVGGIAAYNSGTITNCHNVAELVKGNGYNPIYYYGAVIGYSDNGTASYCFWDEDAYEQPVGGPTSYSLPSECAAITSTTWQTMNTEVSALTAYASYNLHNWKQGNDGYPVFDLSDKAVMGSEENNVNVVLYPNPTNGLVKIEAENITRVSVYNMFGQLVIDQEVNANETELHLNGFAAGVYMVRINTTEGVTSKNVIVE